MTWTGEVFPHSEQRNSCCFCGGFCYTGSKLRSD